MMILDIMGKRTFLQLFKEAYFHGAKGVLAVFDTTRVASLRDLTKWIDGVRDSVGPVPVYALGNKTDLVERREVRDEEAADILRSYECPILYTSAKNGDNVEQAFQGLAKTIVESSQAG
jgi:GTPase SAR1 family protein